MYKKGGKQVSYIMLIYDTKETVEIQKCEIVQYVVNRTINMNKLLVCRYYSCYIRIWFELKQKNEKGYFI